MQFVNIVNDGNKDTNNKFFTKNSSFVLELHDPKTKTQLPYLNNPGVSFIIDKKPNINILAVRSTNLKEYISSGGLAESNEILHILLGSTEQLKLSDIQLEFIRSSIYNFLIDEYNLTLTKKEIPFIDPLSYSKAANLCVEYMEILSDFILDKLNKPSKNDTDDKIINNHIIIDDSFKAWTNNTIDTSNSSKGIAPLNTPQIKKVETNVATLTKTKSVGKQTIKQQIDANSKFEISMNGLHKDTFYFRNRMLLLTMLYNYVLKHDPSGLDKVINQKARPTAPLGYTISEKSDSTSFKLLDYQFNNKDVYMYRMLTVNQLLDAIRQLITNTNLNISINGIKQTGKSIMNFDFIKNKEPKSTMKRDFYNKPASTNLKIIFNNNISKKIKANSNRQALYEIENLLIRLMPEKVIDYIESVNPGKWNALFSYNPKKSNSELYNKLSENKINNRDIYVFQKSNKLEYNKALNAIEEYFDVKIEEY